MRTAIAKPGLFLHWFLLLVGFGIFSLPAPTLAESSDLPLPVRVVLSKAGALVKQKKYDQAIAVLTAFQDLGKASTDAGQPDAKGHDHPEVYFALGTCHLLNQTYGAAVQALEQAVRHDPTLVKAWLNLAKAAYELNDYPRAAGSFQKAYDLEDGKHAEHLYYSAVALLMASRTEPCLSAFETLFKAHGEAVQPVWRENYVHALLTADRPRQALPHIRRLAEVYSGEKQVQWQEILLNQYLQLDMQAEARDYALFLTLQDPSREKWWKALTHVELNAGRYEQALVAMTVFSFLAPLNSRERKLLADLNLQVGIPVKAVPLYETALTEKKDPRLIRSLVLALQQLGKSKQALEALDRLAPPGRDSPTELTMLRGDLLYGLKRFREAGEVYCRAAQGGTANEAGRAWLMAGYAALQTDDPAAGRPALIKAATFKQHRKAALTALRQLPGRVAEQSAGRPSM